MRKIKFALIVLFALLGYNAVFAQLAAGTYYFYNEGAQLYLNYGGNDDYTACFKPHGEPLVLAGSDGQFTVQTALDSRYLSATAATENARQSSGTTFTFTQQADGSYTISSSEGLMGYGGTTETRLSQTIVQMSLTDENSPNARWRILSKEDLLDRFDLASESNPVDATFLVTCPNFDRHHANLSAWSDYTTGNNTGYLCNNAGYKFDSGTVVQQTLSSIPNGVYLMKAQAFYRHGSNGTATGYTEATMPMQGVMFAGSNEVLVKSILSSENRASTNIYEAAGHSGGGREFGGGYIPYGASNNYADACIAFDNGLFAGNEVEAVVTDGSLTIGFKINELTQYSWIAYDNIELYYLGALQDLTPYKDQYYALRSKIQSALIDKTEVYTDPSGAKTTYETACAAQDAIVEAATSQNAIDNAKTDLWAAAKTFMKDVTINDGSYFDLTSFMVNPEVTPSSSTTAPGWTTTANLDFGNYQITQFNSSTPFDMHQTIENMPAGAYAVKVRGFYRPGAFSSSDMTSVANTEVPTMIYLNDTQQALLNICADGSPTQLSKGASTVVGGNTIYIPNSRSHLQAFFDENYYWNNMDAVVGTDGDVTIGLKYDSWVSGGWGVISDFNLYYKGILDLSEYEAQLAVVVNAANELVLPTYQKGLLDAVIADNNKTYSTSEGYQNAIAAINEAKAAAEPFVAPYAEYKALKELVAGKIIAQTDAYTDNVGAGDAYDTAVAATADNVENAQVVGDIESENTAVWNAALTFLKAVNINDGKYFDFTWMIQNADFSNSSYKNFWTESGVSGGTVGVTNGVMRYMSTPFELSQKLAYILPAGQYKLNAGGFERTNNPMANAWSDFQAGTSTVTGAIFLNSSEQLVKNLFDAQTVNDNSLGGVQPDGASFYIPDGSGAANKYIAAGHYPNTLTAMLASDAEVTVGYRCTNSSEWTCIDNFQLYYFGPLDLSGYEAELAAAVNEANQLVIPTYQKGLLDAVITENNKTYASTEDYQNAIAAINEAKAAAEPFVAPYAEYKALKELVNEKFISQTDIYTDTAGAGDAYNAAVATTSDNVENAKAVADIEAENLVVWDAALTFLKTVVINDDKYFDLTWMIKDPDFSDTNYTKYWTETMQSTTTKGTTSGLMRYYNCSFDLSQTLAYKLPAGAYTLKVDGFERTNDPMDTAYSDYAAGNSTVTGTIYFNNNEKLIMNLFDVQTVTDNSLGGVQPSGASFFTPNGSGASAQYLNAGLFPNTLNAKLKEDAEVTLGYRCANTKAWTCFDNFQLFYRGTLTDQVKFAAFEEIASQAIDRTEYDAAVAEAQAKFAAATTDDEKEAANDDVRDALCKLLKEQTTATGRFDITSLIANADFAAGDEGWDVKNAKLNATSLGIGYLSNTTSAASVSQTLEKMPAGHYTFMTQGLYRPTGVVTTVSNHEKGIENILADMYLGETSKPLPSIFDGKRFDASSGSYALIDGSAVPNSISNVSATFGLGEYWDVMEADVAADGDLQMGIKVADNTLADNWAVFGNFHLYYGNATTKDVKYTKFNTVQIPTPANMTVNAGFIQGKLTPLCVPFEVTAEQFEQVYAVGSIDGTSVNNSTAVIYPVSRVKPGQPCVVVPKETTDAMKFNNVIVSPITPDTYILPWSPGRAQALTSNANGSWSYYTLQGSARPATSLKFQPLDIMDADYIVNMESLRAALFLSSITYAETTASVVADYNTTPPVRRDIPNPASVVVPENNANSVKVVYGEKEDFSDAKEQGVVGSGLCYIANLLPQKMYYYKVEADGSVISQGRFFTDGRTRMMYAPTAYNIRDFGGWRTIDGKRTNYGHLFRGSTVNGYAPTTPEDLQRLRDAGVGAEIDLRYKEDYDKDMGCGTSAFGFTTAGGDYYFAAANDYTAANISESGTQARWKQEFEFIVNNFRKGKGVYFHCAWGADRTGLLALLLEGLLGYELDAIYKDYELTSFSAAPGASNRVKSAFQDRITVFQNMSGTNLKNKVENFFLNTLKVSQEDIDYFREVMLGDDNFMVNENKNFSNAKAVKANVNLIRTVTADEISPIVLPFAMTQEEVEEQFGAETKLYLVKSFADNNIVLEPQEGIEANKPAILVAKESGDYYLIPERTVAKTSNVTFRATAVDGVAVAAVYNNGLYIPANGYNISGDVANIVPEAGTTMLKATHGYVTIADEAAETLTFSFADDTTGIVTVEDGSLKFIEGKIYDLSGREVNKPSKGIYIVNGRKVMIK